MKILLSILLSCLVSTIKPLLDMLVKNFMFPYATSLAILDIIFIFQGWELKSTWKQNTKFKYKLRIKLINLSKLSIYNAWKIIVFEWIGDKCSSQN